MPPEAHFRLRNLRHLPQSEHLPLTSFRDLFSSVPPHNSALRSPDLRQQYHTDPLMSHKCASLPLRFLSSHFSRYEVRGVLSCRSFFHLRYLPAAAHKRAGHACLSYILYIRCGSSCHFSDHPRHSPAHPPPRGDPPPALTSDPL